jgi:molybdopterin converting factor small subunit
MPKSKQIQKFKELRDMFEQQRSYIQQLELDKQQLVQQCSVVNNNTNIVPVDTSSDDDCNNNDNNHNDSDSGIHSDYAALQSYNGYLASKLYKLDEKLEQQYALIDKLDNNIIDIQVINNNKIEKLTEIINIYENNYNIINVGILPDSSGEVVVTLIPNLQYQCNNIVFGSSLVNNDLNTNHACTPHTNHNNIENDSDVLEQLERELLALLENKENNHNIHGFNNNNLSLHDNASCSSTNNIYISLDSKAEINIDVIIICSC